MRQSLPLSISTWINLCVFRKHVDFYDSKCLSLPGGYLKAKDIPYAYVLVKADNPEKPASGPLEKGVEYLLMMRVDVAAGYDSGLTRAAMDKITLNGIAAIDYGRDFDETIGCMFALPPVPEVGTTYTAAVIGSYAPATGAGEYMAGDTVALSAGSMRQLQQPVFLKVPRQGIFRSSGVSSILS